MAPGFAIPSSRAARVDAIAHEIAVLFLDDVAEMYADAEFDALFRRQADVAERCRSALRSRTRTASTTLRNSMIERLPFVYDPAVM